jgi:hypothetical protein
MPSPCNDGPSALVPPELCRNIRRCARDSLIDFARAVDVPGRPASEDQDEPRFATVETALARHHQVLLETVERAVKTPNGRAMILMPPGSGKSTYCSVVLPAFLIGRKPGYRVIVASYGTDLAKKHGRRARAIVRSARYQQIFKTTLGREACAAGGFALTNGSEYMAAGLLAGITGNRADGLVIDDPVKGRDEADSRLTRERTRASYEDDLKTRLRPGGCKPIQHHPPAAQTDQARLLNVALTLKIEMQDGRRFSATLSSQGASEKLVGIISRTGTIFMADDDGTDYATLLGPDRMEICHLRGAPETRLASCAEFTRQP